MHLSRFNLDGAATLDNYTFANSPSHSPCALPLDVDPVAQRDIRPNLDGPVVAHECCVLVPPEVGPIVADPESLAVTPYQRDPL